MKIQHNIMAMNAYRNLGMNNSKLNKNLEKLSSGYRINRAGDDAAGLAISEKMRSQIAGLEQAQKNAQSGINLVQTAEGALTEVHDMLNRMVTLATQAANGTYSPSDQAKVQSEIDSLTEEIDRIAKNSNFNGTKLLDGNLGGVQFNDDYISNTASGKNEAGLAAVSVSGGSLVAADKITVKVGSSNKGLTVGVTAGSGGVAFTASNFDIEIKDAGGNTVTSSTVIAGNASYTATFKAKASATAAEKAAYDGMTVSFTTGNTLNTKTSTFEIAAAGNGLQLQIGSSKDETITVNVDSMSAQSLGIDKGSMNVGDPAAANAAIDTINAAIETVSVQRSNLGAIQNRLEHTINNLGVMEENIQDAEANIRDTDIADEMMAYTKNNILIQSAQAMLAQANQVPQGVLQLMQ